uniref:Uncharacterized protein n=1 Tax=viral metagenome TaxID=1070528 RepID=A0A6H2A3Y1_9ZZZZ
MGIETERKALHKLMKKDGKKDYKALARKIRMPYSTLLSLVKEETLGAIRSWIKIERYFTRRG